MSAATIVKRAPVSFLPPVDGSKGVDDAVLSTVVTINPDATPSVLVSVAAVRQSRLVALLDELACLSINETARLSVLAEIFRPMAQEVLTLLDAAIEREVPAPVGKVRKDGAP